MNEPVTLVTTATVSRLSDGAVLEVTHPYIVTPSAAELARKKSVRIKLAGGPETSSVCNTGCPPHRAGDVNAQMSYANGLASKIDSTLLNPDATAEQVKLLCTEAAQLGCAAVCVNPIFTSIAFNTLGADGPAVAAVCGFPLGASQTAVKAAEARLAEAQGAREIDMVMPIGMLKAGELKAVHQDIAGVRRVLANTTLLKVIIEAPLLTDEEKVTAAAIAVESGAEFVKTGTGHCGSVCSTDVALLRQAIGHKAKIKAAGGIRDCHTATALLDAGADRLGTSCAAELIRDCQPDST